MSVAFTILLVVACGWAVARPAFATVLLIYIFSIEQVLQSVVPALRATPVGNQLFNYVIAGVVGIAWARSLAKNAPASVGLFNPTMLVVSTLLLWSIVTVFWSPGRELGLAVLSVRWPYYFVVVVLGSSLLASIDDVGEMLQGLVVTGAVLCSVILLSPDFESQYGRIGIVESGKMASNPLAIGELGGVVVITSALLRSARFGKFGLALRVFALMVGIAVAVKSGSRGQLLFSAGVATIAFPFSARVRNFGGFVAAVGGAIVIALAVILLSSTLLEGFAAQRFSLDSLLYGSSSTSERASNVVVLATAWASSPTAPLVGLGYYAFSSFGLGIEYSHVIAADMLFELGIPGAVLYVALIVLSFQTCRALVRDAAADDVDRSRVGAFVALIAFYFLLSNKQGDLWGIVTFFMLVCAAHRVRIRRDLLGPERAAIGWEVQ